MSCVRGNQKANEHNSDIDYICSKGIIFIVSVSAHSMRGEYHEHGLLRLLFSL